jgi:hypothetical protein
MKRIIVYNKTRIKIPIEKWFDEIKDDAETIDDECYPLKVIVTTAEYDKEKGHHERSHFIPNDNVLHLKITPGSTLREIKWSFMHEFRHFMQRNKSLLRNATHEDIDLVELKALIDRIKVLDFEQFYDTFHDLFPFESDAITYATQKAGKNFRKHPLQKGILKYLNESYNRLRRRRRFA